jgi:hypothetical protein
MWIRYVILFRTCQEIGRGKIVVNANIFFILPIPHFFPRLPEIVAFSATPADHSRVMRSGYKPKGIHNAVSNRGKRIRYREMYAKPLITLSILLSIINIL